MPKQVVLPHSLPTDVGTPQASHKDAWHQFEGLVFVLIGIHVAALAFWGYLLYASRERKRARQAASKVNSQAGSASAMSCTAPSSTSEWRTPKEIKRAYQKQHIGKH